MPQSPYSVTASQSGSAYAEDVNATFLSIQTNNSGNTAPTSLQALQVWADTATNFMRLRDAGNNSWLNLYPLDKSLATYVGELIAVFGLGTTAPLKLSDNLNSVDPTGFYRITTSTTNNTYGNGSVVVINRGGGVVDQLIISVTNSKLYFRNTANNGSLWSVLGEFSDLSSQVNSNTTKVAVLESFGVPKGYVFTPVPQYATARTITVNGDAYARSQDNVYNITVTGNHTVSLDTTGIDGLSTGTVAPNTFYYLYACSKEDGTGGGYVFDTNQGTASFSLGASNRILRSEELDNATWVKGGSPVATVTPNLYLAPSGEVTADRITDSTDTAGSQISQAPSPTTTTSTLSFYCKRVDTDWLRVTYAQSSNQVRLWINLATRTLGATSTSGTAPTGISTTITDVGNGWDRVTLTATFASTTSMNVVFATASANSSTTRVSNGSYALWGVQVNNGGVAEAYTKSEGSVVTGSTTLRARQLPLAVRTDGSSNILPFYITSWRQREAITMYYDSQTIVSGVTATNDTWTTASLTGLVPVGAIAGSFFGHVSRSAASGTTTLYTRPQGGTATTGTMSAYFGIDIASNTGGAGSSFATPLTSTRQLEWKVVRTGTPAQIVTITLNGYTMNV